MHQFTLLTLRDFLARDIHTIFYSRQLYSFLENIALACFDDSGIGAGFLRRAPSNENYYMNYTVLYYYMNIYELHGTLCSMPIAQYWPSSGVFIFVLIVSNISVLSMSRGSPIKVVMEASRKEEYSGPGKVLAGSE